MAVLTILRDIGSRIAYAEACGEVVVECLLCPDAWDEAMQALEPYQVCVFGQNLRYRGVDIVRTDRVSWIALKTRRDGVSA